MVTFNDLIERIKFLCDLETDAEVAEWLGISVGDLYNRRCKNILPLKRLALVAEQHELDIRDLLYGRGPSVPRYPDSNKSVSQSQ